MNIAREQYLEERNANVLNFVTVHQYFTMKSGIAMHFEQFAQAIRFWMDVMGQQAGLAIQRTLDRHFELTIMTDKNGQFIKAW